MVIAAVAVAKAAHMIAEYWPTIVQALSHVVNFCYESDDSHRALTYERADSLEKIAAEFEKVKTRNEFRDVAYAFESNADFFLLAANAIRNNVNLLPSDAHCELDTPFATKSFMRETSTIEYFLNFLSAHQHFTDEMRALDPTLHSELSGFYRYYTPSVSK